MLRNRRTYRNAKPRKPPITDPCQSILNLNHDCLYELFTYLPLKDLCSIGITCNRLNEVARKLYSRHFANLNAKHFLTNNRHNLMTERKMGVIIEKIAHYVKAFEILEEIEENNSSRSWQALIRLILLHCRNITDLKIGFHINERFSQEISALENFQKLKTLYISTDSIGLNNMSRLENLHITSYHAYNMSYLLPLKNLKSLYLRGMTIDSDLLSQICGNNPDIKQMEIPNQTDRNTNSANLTVIIDKLVNLEEIVIPLYYCDYLYQSTIHRIPEIKNLKRLSISDSAPELLAKLIELDQLESLTYSCANPDDMELITKFTKLKYLCVTNFNDIHMNSLKSQCILEHAEFNFSNSITNKGVITFVKGAINLKYLSLCETYNCNEDVLEMLMDLVRNCSRKSKLTVNCDFIFRFQIKDYPLLDLIVLPYRQDYDDYYSSY